MAKGGVLASFLLARGAFSATPVTALQAPCDPTGYSANAVCDPSKLTSGYLRSCACVLNNPSPIKSGDGTVRAPTGILAGLKTQIWQAATYYYQGTEFDPSAPPGANPPGTPVPVPMCSLIASPFTIPASGGAPIVEEDKNHLSQDCGLPFAINYDIRIAGSPASGKPDCLGSGKRCGTHVCIVHGQSWIEQCVGNNSSLHYSLDYGDPTGPGKRGAREGAWARGLYPQALYCYYHQVLKEIQSAHGLTKISPSCQALATSAAALMAQAGQASSDVITDLKTTLGATAAASTFDPNEIWKCDLTESEQSASADKRDRTAKQRAQHLCAIRLMIESVFGQAAVCEVMARTGTQYDAVLNEDPGGIFGHIREQIVKQDFLPACNLKPVDLQVTCNSECHHHCNYSHCHGVNGVDGTNCSKCLNNIANGVAPEGSAPGRMNPCLYGLVKNYFATKYDEFDWDKNGSCR